MHEPTNNHTERSLASLVGGVVDDLMHLLEQQLAMFQQEFRDEVHLAKEAVLQVAVSGGLAAAGALLLLAALIGFLSWAMPAVPWWGWCGLLGGVTLIAAAALFYFGKQKLGSVGPVPEQSVQAAKENLQWISDRISTTAR